jgi:hypothetical protein
MTRSQQMQTNQLGSKRPRTITQSFRDDTSRGRYRIRMNIGGHVV